MCFLQSADGNGPLYLRRAIPGIQESQEYVAEHFFIADLHLGHQRMVTPDEHGYRLRPFETVEEMNETLIHRWNACVGPKDKVYVLGDLMMNKRYHTLLNCLNGTKELVAGNHDEDATQVYLQYFTKVRGAHSYRKQLILTHIPVHPAQLEERWLANIHGHLHSARVADPRYVCVSAEQTGFAPVAWPVLQQRLRQAGVVI